MTDWHCELKEVFQIFLSHVFVFSGAWSQWSLTLSMRLHNLRRLSSTLSVNPQEWSTLFFKTRISHRDPCQLDWAGRSVNSMDQIGFNSQCRDYKHVPPWPGFYADAWVQGLYWLARCQPSHLLHCWAQPWGLLCTCTCPESFCWSWCDSCNWNLGLWVHGPVWWREASFPLGLSPQSEQAIWVYLGCWWHKQLLLGWCHPGGQGAAMSSSARMFSRISSKVKKRVFRPREPWQKGSQPL